MQWPPAKAASVASKQKLNMPPSAVNVQQELSEGSAQSEFAVQSLTISLPLHEPPTVVGQAALFVHAVIVDEVTQLGNDPLTRCVVPQQIGVPPPHWAGEPHA
jgi:hypothetical protein